MVAQLEISAKTAKTAEVPPYNVDGLVQVFTSPQRSFFTDAIAQAFRVAGQGTPVLVVQFLKGGIRQGHDRPMQFGEHLHWLRCNVPRCIGAADLAEAETEALQALWHHTRDAIAAGRYDLVMLDELSTAVHLGLIPLEEVLEAIAQRPRHVDVILMGSHMPPEVLYLADQVTEVRRSRTP